MIDHYLVVLHLAASGVWTRPNYLPMSVRVRNLLHYNSSAEILHTCAALSHTNQSKECADNNTH